MNAPPEISGALASLRRRGWTVGVHNDYWLDGKAHTFWLFTHPATGYFAKGEGLTDSEALAEVEKNITGIVVSIAEDGEFHKRCVVLANRVLAEVKLAKRWPCPDCGREGPDAPLRTLRIAVTDARHVIEIPGTIRFTGCWRCNEGDRLVALAERVSTP